MNEYGRIHFPDATANDIWMSTPDIEGKYQSHIQKRNP